MEKEALEKFLIFTCKIGTGYVPIIGPILSQLINEAQSRLNQEKYNNLLNDFRKIVKKSPEYKTSISIEAFEKNKEFSQKKIPSISSEKKEIEEFNNQLTEFCNECNETDRSFILFKPLFDAAAIDPHSTKQSIAPETKLVMLDQAYELCHDLEKTILHDNNTVILFYYGLALFFYNCFGDKNNYTLFMLKAIEESENEYIKVYLLTHLWASGREPQFSKTVPYMTYEAVTKEAKKFVNQSLQFTKEIKKFYDSIDPLKSSNKQHTPEIKNETDSPKVTLDLTSFIDKGKDINGILCTVYSHIINALSRMQLRENGKTPFEDTILLLSEDFYTYYEASKTEDSDKYNALEICNRLLGIQPSARS